MAAVILCVGGIATLLLGLFVSSVTTYAIYVGYLLFAIGCFWAICSFGCHRTRAFKVFLLCWLAGALLTTAFFIPMSIIAMGSTSIIHLPLLAAACYVAKLKDRARYLTLIFYPCAFILAMVLPHFMVLSFEKPYPREAEEIKVTADVIEDKKPQYLDEDSMWHEDSIKNRLWRENVIYRINKSAAVIGLDIGEIKDEEKDTTELLFATYGEAISYAKEKDLSFIPSVQMMDHKSKVFADSFYAAIEKFIQQNGEKAGGGKQAFLTNILNGLIEREEEVVGYVDAMAYIATGLELGGQNFSLLPEEVRSISQRLKSDFLAHPIRSKPIGFYNESQELKSIFQQDRFYQTCLSPEAAIAIAKVLNENPELRNQYQALLAVYSHLTNPPSRFSVNEVANYAEHFDNPTIVLNQMLKSKKWETLKKRGAGREEPIPCIQFLPYSTSKENELYAKIYNYSAELPQHSIMNRLIRAVRAGEISLTPNDDSGWYDYQIHALETLLVPEMGQENAKLLLTKAYKKRLIEAFKTILTKKRELHVKQVELIPTLGIAWEPGYLRISPDLDLEPMTTYYLRTARGYRFILKAITHILGEESLRHVPLENDQSLIAETEKMSRLYYGLYLKVCENIGMKPNCDSDELSGKEIEWAKEEATNWLEDPEKDVCCKRDVRYIVPALVNQRRTQARYWMTVGVKLLKIKADYVKRPRVQIVDLESGDVIQEISTGEESGVITGTHLKYRFVPEECFLPVEVFAEATGPAKPFTRDEFRRLCDQCKSKRKVVQAIQSTVIFNPFGTLAIVVVAGVGIFLMIFLFRFLKNKPAN